MSRSGVYDWLIQRVSAVILALYTLCILGFVLLHPDPGYGDWAAFMGGRAMRIFTLLALLSVCAHAWVGMWTIGSDYLSGQGRVVVAFRYVYQLGCLLVILAYLVWGIDILRGSP